jgi:hypothetical protein
MDLKLEDSLFPLSIRRHPSLSEKEKKQWYADTYFSEHLEMQSLRQKIYKESTFGTAGIDTLMCSLEIDTQKIEFRKYLSQTVLCALQKNSIETITLPSPVEIKKEHGSLVSPVNVLNSYETSLKQGKRFITSLQLHEPYFVMLTKHFDKQLSQIETIREEQKTDYEIRADFSFKLTLETRHKLKRVNQQHYKKTKEIEKQYVGELISMHNLSVVNYENGEQRVFPKDIVPGPQWNQRGYQLLGLYCSNSEVIQAAVNQIHPHIPKSWKFKTGEELTVRATINTRQKGFTSFTTNSVYAVSNGKNTFTTSIEKKTSAGFPFDAALRQEKSSSLENHMRSLVKTIEKYNFLFSDIESLYYHAKISEFLLSKGAKWAEISETGNELFVAKDMKIPYLVLTGNNEKKVIPNDVTVTQEKNVQLGTGANFNGKTVYGIGQAQNFMLMQASFPGFFKEARFTPRDAIISIFSDYAGTMKDGESRHSADCASLYEGLTRLTPQAFFMVDEIGIGTDPQEGADLAQRTWEHVTELQNVMMYGTTHYKDRVRSLLATHPNINPLAFDFDANKNPTYKAQSGKVATSSEGEIIAKKYSLDDEGFKNIKSIWKEKGLL